MAVKNATARRPMKVASQVRPIRTATTARRAPAAPRALTTADRYLRSGTPSRSSDTGRAERVELFEPPAPPPAEEAGREEVDVVIVGGGISGLSTAQALRARHSASVARLLVTEAGGSAGGVISSVAGEGDKAGYLWEEGPNSFAPTPPMLRAMKEAGVRDELVLGDPKAPRFVLWDRQDGKGPALAKAPSDLLDLAACALLSPKGTLRALLGAFGVGVEPAPEGVEESIEAFVTRHLGPEAFERLAAPVCGGVFAGDPAKLSAEAALGQVHRLQGLSEGMPGPLAGSLGGGALRLLSERLGPVKRELEELSADLPEPLGGTALGGAFMRLRERLAGKQPPQPETEAAPAPPGQAPASFRGGLGALPEAMAAELGDELRLGWTLTSLSKGPAETFDLAYSTPEGPRRLRARSVVLTVPAYAAAPLLRPHSEEARDALLEVYYPPVAAVTLAYPESAIRAQPPSGESGRLEGYGQLHPRGQGASALGAIYSSRLFPGRCPEGEVLLLSYLGGAADPGALDRSEEALAAQVDQDLRLSLLAADAPPPKVLSVRVWPKGLPQRNVGHAACLRTAREGLDRAGLAGVLLGGSYVSGVSLGECVEHGQAQAAEAAARCEATRPALSEASDEDFFV